MKAAHEGFCKLPGKERGMGLRESVMMHVIRPWLVFTACLLLILPSAMQLCRGADRPVPSSPTAVVEGPSGVPGMAEEMPTSAQDRPSAFVLPPPPDYSILDGDWIGSPLL